METQAKDGKEGQPHKQADPKDAAALAFADGELGDGEDCGHKKVDSEQWTVDSRTKIVYCSLLTAHYVSPEWSPMICMKRSSRERVRGVSS